MQNGTLGKVMKKWEKPWIVWILYQNHNLCYNRLENEYEKDYRHIVIFLSYLPNLISFY